MVVVKTEASKEKDPETHNGWFHFLFHNIHTHKTLCRFCFCFFLQTCKVEVTASHKSQNVIVVFIAENNKSQISLWGVFQTVNHTTNQPSDPSCRINDCAISLKIFCFDSRSITQVRKSQKGVYIYEWQSSSPSENTTARWPDFLRCYMNNEPA